MNVERDSGAAGESAFGTVKAVGDCGERSKASVKSCFAAVNDERLTKTTARKYRTSPNKFALIFIVYE